MQGLERRLLAIWSTLGSSGRSAGRCEMHGRFLLAVAAWALKIQQMFITKRNALMIKFILLTTQETEIALVDSGATENFLDPRTVSKMELPTQKLDKE